MTYQEKVKSYMKVFYILIALTVVELIFVELPKMYPSIPHIPMVILICAASLAKAVYVAYYFMHLNHETPWLRKLIFLSLICFFYAAVLIPDTIMDRKQVKYIPEPARIYTNKKDEPVAAPAKSAPVTTPDNPIGAPSDSKTTDEAAWE